MKFDVFVSFSSFRKVYLYFLFYVIFIIFLVSGFCYFYFVSFKIKFGEVKCMVVKYLENCWFELILYLSLDFFYL